VRQIQEENCDPWAMGIRIYVSLSSILSFHVLGDSFENHGFSKYSGTNRPFSE